MTRSSIRPAVRLSKPAGAGMWSGMTNPSRPWKKFGCALPWVDLDRDSKEYMEKLSDTSDVVLAQSNFYQTMAQAFADVSAFGSAPVIAYEDQEDVVRFYLCAWGEYCLRVGARQAIDSLYREFCYTVKQIVEWAGIDHCPSEVVAMWRQGGASHDREFVVCHAIEPNFAVGDGDATTDDYRPLRSVLPKTFAYRDVYWVRDLQSDQPLSIRGFHVKPFFVFRWHPTSNEPYARSPAEQVLGDQKQIQLQTVRLNEFIEKGVRPPMGADPALKMEPASIMPAHITYMNIAEGKKGFWPLFEVQAQWVTAMGKVIEDCANRIKTGFFVDVFMAITQMQGVQPRNGLELTKRDLERLQKLGPVINNTEEALNDCFVRLLDILQRRRMTPPPPQSMRGVPLKVAYISIMRLAQEQAKSVGIKDFLGTLGAMSSAAKAGGVPDPIRRWDLDGITQELGELAGVPAKYRFSDEQLAEHDAARQKATEQAQAPQQMMSAVQAAKTLSETNVGQGNALSALMGGGQ